MYTLLRNEIKGVYIKKPHLSNHSWNQMNIGSEKQLGKIGKLHDKKIILNNDLVKKIMCVNKLALPDVLIDIIKDYLYYSCDILYHLILTNNLNDYIDVKMCKEGQFVLGETDGLTYETTTKFYIYGSNRYYCYDIEVGICFQCGNYTNNYMYNDESYSRNLLCHCKNHPYYQELENIQTFYVGEIDANNNNV